MRAFVFVFLFLLLIPTISFADSGTVITFTDGRQITADLCAIEGDNIFYTINGKNYQTTFNEVETISSFNEPAPELTSAPDASDMGKLNENTKPENASSKKTMKEFAKWVDYFFDHEPQLRTAARGMANNLNDQGFPNFGQDIMGFYKEISSKSGVSLEKYFLYDPSFKAKLTPEDERVYDKCIEGISFYLMQLPGEEGVKAGIIAPPKHKESETPAVLKLFIKSMLKNYKS